MDASVSIVPEGDQFQPLILSAMRYEHEKSMVVELWCVVVNDEI
jgi:hypothetical protein